MVKLKKRKLNPYKIARIAIILLFFIAAPFVLRNIFRNEDKIFINVVDSLELYSYELREDDSDYQKEIFSELKRVLNEEEIDEEEYAKYLGKLFVIDFYTMDTKINNQDIGGVKFVHSDFQEHFVDYARDETYSHVESRLGRSRNQVLPIVSKVSLYEMETADEFVEDLIFMATFEIEYANADQFEELPPQLVEVIISYEDSKLVIIDFTTDTTNEVE